MSKPTLSRLKRIPLKDYWEHEALEFTPWLAQKENISLLGEAIGRELVVEAQEKAVGPFQADILCKDTLCDDHWVLIENQLQRTDHTHLGQLLTYAAGLRTVTIIWIADQFTEEHRAALDWLNDITDDSFTFFGIEIELWKIGDSPMAPQFNIVSKPNDWSRSVRASAAASKELTATKQTQLAFWTNFTDYMERQGSIVRCRKPQPQHWMNHPIGRAGFLINSIASVEGGEIRAEFIIDHKDSKEYYALLEEHKEEIDREIGDDPIWYNVEGVRNCRVYVRRPADITNKDKWPEYNKWLKDNLETLQKIFAGRVKQLNLEKVN